MTSDEGSSDAYETVDLWIVDSEGNPVDDPELFNSLHNSLNRNQYIKENAELALRAPREVMGLDVAAIQLIFYVGFELAQLALAVSKWRSERAQKQKTAGSIAVWTNDQKTILHPDDLNEHHESPKVLRALSGAPDPKLSTCVLIGVSDYANLPRLPGVQHNLVQLRGVFADPEIWGIPAKRIHEIDYTQQSAETIIAAIAAAVEEAVDTLLVYFAGHGFFDGQELRLALPEATEDGNDQTVRWEEVASIIRKTDCLRKVVWLDCCHAGRAVRRGATDPTGNPSTLPKSARPQGFYLFAAVQNSERAMAPKKSKCTAFTGEIIESLRRGIALDPPEDFLNMNSLHKNVSDKLVKKHYPKPTRHDPSEIGQRPHFYNKSKDRPGNPWRSDPDDPWWSPIRSHLKAIAVAVSVLVVLAVVWFIPGSDVGGLDLGKHCLMLSSSEGSQTFVVARDSCAQTVDLNSACDFTYQTQSMVAKFLSSDPRSAQCYNSESSPTGRGGIRDMSGYCAARTGVPGVKATPNNPLFAGTWVCQSDVNADLECDNQYNRFDLSSGEDENGNLVCYKTHWF